MENFELYEHIKDTFYYGLFADFKLVIDKATGYFNATKLCIEGGKIFGDWKVLEKSKRLTKYYGIYEIEGNNEKYTGTYVPKELILDIASWISIEFYDKCVNEFKTKTFQNEELKRLEKEKEELKKIVLRLEKSILEKDSIIEGKTFQNEELREIILKYRDREREEEKIECCRYLVS